MKKQIYKNKNSQSGQSLVEYLILVAVIGIGSLAVIRGVSQNLNVRFAKVAESLGGRVEGNKQANPITENMYRKKSLKDFANGSVSDGD